MNGLGKLAEMKACEYLQKKKYKLIERIPDGSYR